MKQARIHIICTAAVFLMSAGLSSQAQEKVHVASRTISRNYTSDIVSVIINSEKAEIFLYPATDGNMRIEVKLISKNIAEKTALSDFKAIKFEISEETGIVRMKNYYQPAGERPVKSNLNVRYTIHLPKSVTLEINSLYSKIDLHSAGSDLKIDAAFSELTSENCNGTIFLKSYYSGLTIKGGNGKLTGNLDKSDLSLKDYKGSAELTTRYGQVNIEQNQPNAGIRLAGNYTEIILEACTGVLKNLHLTVISGSIEVPEAYRSLTKKEKNKTILNIMQSPPSSLMEISTTYNNIKLYETKE